MNGFKWIPLCLLLTACGASPLNLLTGGGPNVAANVQAGAENNQALGVSNRDEKTVTRSTARTIDQSSSGTGIRSEKVETVVVEAAADWVWVLIAGVLIGIFIGWTIDTPRDMMFGRRNGSD